MQLVPLRASTECGAGTALLHTPGCDLARNVSLLGDIALDVLFFGVVFSVPGPFRLPAAAQERKRILTEGADCIIALPGGLGTWDELWEMVCLKGIGEWPEASKRFHFRCFRTYTLHS